MGFIISNGINPIEASVENNKLCLHFGNHIREFDLSKLGNDKVVFPKQCNLFKNNFIVGYLRNKDYNLYLSFDGWAQVTTLCGNYLCKTFRYDVPQVTINEEHLCGQMYNPLLGAYDMIRGYSLSDSDFILSGVDRPLSVAFNLENNPAFKNLLSKFWDKQVLTDIDVSKDKVLNYIVGGKDIIKVEGTCYKTDGYYLL